MYASCFGSAFCLKFFLLYFQAGISLISGVVGSEGDFNNFNQGSFVDVQRAIFRGNSDFYVSLCDLFFDLRKRKPYAFAFLNLLLDESMNRAMLQGLMGVTCEFNKLASQTILSLPLLFLEGEDPLLPVTILHQVNRLRCVQAAMDEFLTKMPSPLVVLPVLQTERADAQEIASPEPTTRLSVSPKLY